MVQTRSQRRNSGQRPRAFPLPIRGQRPRYKPEDRCKRHRLPDRKRKNVQVVAYTRRKPS